MNQKWNIGNIIGQTLKTNTWYHAVLTYDSSKKVQKLYLNGQLQGGNSGTPSLPSSMYIYLGQREKDCSFTSTSGLCSVEATYFNGTMDDFRVYNRALSESEIQELYTGETTISTPTPTVTPTTTPSLTPTPSPTTTTSDTTAPSGSVSINSGASYTNSTAVTLSLSATDNVGVVGYYTSTSSSTPTASASGWNSVTSTTSYSGSVSYTLASGDENKTVYVWYKDAAGNVSSTASDSITLDTVAPVVTITSPTSSDTYTTTSSPISLGGTASDSTSGVSSITWSSNRGGFGIAIGTTNWSVTSINLSSGDNTITVTATDNAGNTSTDTLTITYNPITGVTPTPTTSPAPTLTPLPTPQVSPSPVQEGCCLWICV